KGRNELLAHGIEGMRRVRSVVASHGINGQCVLPGMRRTAGGISGSAETPCRWPPAAVGAGRTLHGGCAGGRCAMSAAVVVLPMVWATADASAARRKTGFQRQAEAAAREQERVQALVAKLVKQHRPDPSVAFYRKYTEAMLRRYVRMSMGAGRVPSLLGRELFRGK